MTEYDFVLVQMTKTNAPFCDFFIWTMHEPEELEWVRCDVKKSKDKCIDFCHFHVNKIISFVNLIHTRHQRN